MNQSIDLKEILFLIRKNRKILSLVLMTTVLIGTTVGLLIPPKYEAKIDLLINSSSRDNDTLTLLSNEIETSLSLIETYKHFLKSNRMLSKVLTNLQDSYTKSEIVENIQIETSSNSQIISIISQEKSPEKAAVLANVYATTFQEEIKELMNLENIMILSKVSAETDIKTINPSTVLYFIISFVIGILICVIILLIKELYFTELNSPTKTEKFLQLRTLGTIPFIKNRVRKNEKTEYYQGMSIDNLKAPNYLMDELRKLSIYIQHKMNKNKLQTILITSTNRKDGKSFICKQLATVLAIDGQKTVFVDVDFRNSKARLQFDLPERKGITSYLSDHYELKQIIQNTKIKNLSFIGTGPIPPNPLEIISSEKLKKLFQDLRKEFDFIILDTPSLEVVDAVALSTHADCCLYVVDSEKTKEDQAINSLNQLRNVHPNILGIVLNKFRN